MLLEAGIVFLTLGGLPASGAGQSPASEVNLTLAEDTDAERRTLTALREIAQEHGFTIEYLLQREGASP